MPPTSSARSWQVVRELAGLVLIVAGLAATLTAAFLVDVVLGVAVAGLAAIAVGYRMSTAEATP